MSKEEKKRTEIVEAIQELKTKGLRVQFVGEMLMLTVGNKKETLRSQVRMSDPNASQRVSVMMDILPSDSLSDINDKIEIAEELIAEATKINEHKAKVNAIQRKADEEMAELEKQSPVLYEYLHAHICDGHGFASFMKSLVSAAEQNGFDFAPMGILEAPKGGDADTAFHLAGRAVQQAQEGRAIQGSNESTNQN